jgi:hypothetical protein
LPRDFLSKRSQILVDEGGLCEILDPPINNYSATGHVNRSY